MAGGGSQSVPRTMCDSSSGTSTILLLPWGGMSSYSSSPRGFVLRESDAEVSLSVSGMVIVTTFFLGWMNLYYSMFLIIFERLSLVTTVVMKSERRTGIVRYDPDRTTRPGFSPKRPP